MMLCCSSHRKSTQQATQTEPSGKEAWLRPHHTDACARLNALCRPGLTLPWPCRGSSAVHSPCSAPALPGQLTSLPPLQWSCLGKAFEGWERGITENTNLFSKSRVLTITPWDLLNFTFLGNTQLKFKYFCVGTRVCMCHSAALLAMSSPLRPAPWTPPYTQGTHMCEFLTLPESVMQITTVRS